MSRIDIYCEILNPGSVNVALGKHWTKFIVERVKSGRYQNRSEVIREALRIFEALEFDRDAIDQALDEADMELAIEVKDPKKFFKDLRKEVHAEHAQRAKKSAA